MAIPLQSDQRPGNKGAMKHPLRKLCWLLLVLALPSLAQAWSGMVVKVTDGDTVTVLDQENRQVKIRLYGIDAPERKQPYGGKATEHLRQLVTLKDVEVVEFAKDRYGRVVADLTLDGESIPGSMVRDGYGWVYRQYCTKDFCRDWVGLEAQARQARAGLWVDKAPTPPWLWRRKK